MSIPWNRASIISPSLDHSLIITVNHKIHSHHQRKPCGRGTLKPFENTEYIMHMTTAEIIKLFRGLTCNFHISIKRTAPPVMMKPKRSAKAIKAAMRIITRTALK
jgi:hypothetical protein